jgi:hypothetical protein
VIVPLAAFELLERLKTLPLDPLVEALRDLHERGATGVAFPAQPPRSAGGPAGASTALASIADALAPVAARPPDAPRGADYETARRHFVRHSQRLREQATLAERLLDGLVRHEQQTPAPLQRELCVTCPAGGSSRAPFIVVNALERDVTVAFRIGRLHGPARVAMRVSVDPPSLALPRGDEARVAAVVGVPGDARVGMQAELGVDVLGDERLLMKLWLQIAVGASEGGDDKAGN